MTSAQLSQFTCSGLWLLGIKHGNSGSLSVVTNLDMTISYLTTNTSCECSLNFTHASAQLTWKSTIYKLFRMVSGKCCTNVAH